MTGIFFVAAALLGAHAKAAANPSAYVTNQGNNTVSVISTNNNAVVATIPVGAFPTGVAITPDGTHAYVTNFKDSTVSVIATTNNAVVATIPVGNAPAPGVPGGEPRPSPRMGPTPM
jgi:YVTN family beta-propeller protein